MIDRALPRLMPATRLGGFEIVTANLALLCGFYGAIGFTASDPVSISPRTMAMLGLDGRGERVVLRLGEQWVALTRYEAAGQPYPRALTAADIAFQHLAIVTSDAAAAWQRAERAGATAISRDGPVTLPQSAGGVTAIKFRDPEGHPLEFLQFPADNSHGWSGNGILGIDHSAISVANVGRSAAFYREFGLAITGRSRNAGMAQDRLDGLDDVAVDVVALALPVAGPHLELLGYQNPRGRQAAHMQPNDIAATRIVWRGAADGLCRDPDGHLHLFESQG